MEDVQWRAMFSVRLWLTVTGLMSLSLQRKPSTRMAGVVMLLTGIQLGLIGVPRE